MATIKDVALRARVSTATVSYVINKTRFVSEELTGRVLQAIEELSFSPSKVAQSLRRGKSSIIGMVIDDITNRFAAEFTKGLESVASAEQYSIIISDLHEDPANEPRAIGMLLDQMVDGIIYAGYGAAEDKLCEAFADGLPVVTVDQPLPTCSLPSVLIDNKASAIAALEHLESIGRTDIVFINGLQINRNGLLRAEAFQQFMTQRGLPAGEERIIYGDYTLQHGYQSALRLLKEKRSFNALFCGDDTIAFGAMAALKSRRVKIPEDVAVVGFDDDPMAPVFEPSLTTVHYPIYEMGQTSFRLFRKLVGRTRRRQEHINLDTRLVVRRSTNPRFEEYQDLMAAPGEVLPTEP